MRRNGITSPDQPASAARSSKRWSSDMAERVIKLPDVGEGGAEAELVEWHVKVGGLVREDALLAAVMTDKEAVCVPTPVEGGSMWLGAKVGDVVAIGSDLVRLKVPGEAETANRKDVPEPQVAEERIAGSAPRLAETASEPRPAPVAL